VTEHGKQATPAGARAWIISDGKAGHEALCLGVADALGVTVEWKRIAPKGIWKAFAPWAPVRPSERFGAPATLFAPPWPDFAFAAGRTTTPYIRALKKKAGDKTFTVIMMDPKTGPATADMFWVPDHDRMRGENVINTLTAPHPLSPARLTDIRQQPHLLIDALPAPRLAVLIGGPNERYRYPEGVMRRLVELIRSAAEIGASLMITASRRTPPDIVAALDEAAASRANVVLWKGEGENPYRAFLAKADAFLVTADSINMAGEAAATGKPIYIFEPEGGAPKFAQFHAALAAKGVTRQAPERFTALDAWDYDPLYAAATIADEIRLRWRGQRTMLPGLT
jgi:mitochondrial fission protein ELM1